MPEIDTVFSETKRREAEKTRRVVENAHCPSCGARFNDVTEEFSSGKLDRSKGTYYYVITTEVNRSVGKCRRNCRYKGHWGGKKV